MPFSYPRVYVHACHSVSVRQWVYACRWTSLRRAFRPRQFVSPRPSRITGDDEQRPLMALTTRYSMKFLARVFVLSQAEHAAAHASSQVRDLLELVILLHLRTSALNGMSHFFLRVWHLPRALVRRAEDSRRGPYRRRNRCCIIARIRFGIQRRN